MAQPLETLPQSDEALMQAFIDEHGAPPSEDDGAPPPAAEAAAERVESEAQEDKRLLDPDTLAELGLTPDGQPDDGESGVGTEQADIDLSPFARALGVDPQELSVQDGEVVVRTKVDGEVATVPLSKLREGYQLRQHFTRQQEQFLAERRAWEEARQQAEQQFAQQAGLAQEVLEAEERQLNQQYTRDWTALRQEDPAEYAAQVAEYNQRLQQLRQKKQQLFEAVQKRQQEWFSQQQQQVQQEVQKFAEITGWTTPEKFQQNGARLRSYLVEKIGLAPEAVDSLADHRALLVAEKARKFDELMEKVQTSKKQVKETHQMPSGTASRQPSGKQSKVQQAKQRLVKTGALEDAASVFASMGFE